MSVSPFPDDRSSGPLPGAGGDAPGILLVEDHAGTRLAVMELLRSAFACCRLLAADSAEAALPLCAAEAPAIVVMDISLPGINGIDATRLIRQAHPGTQVIMHSSSDQPIYREESLAAGAAAFVGKGRSGGELVAAIDALLHG